MMVKIKMSSLPILLIAFLALLSLGWAQSSPSFTVLYSFTGGADGANPSSTMVRDAHGNLFGTTHFGADIDCNLSLHQGCGTVFQLDTAGNLTPLYTFPGGTLEGGAGVVLDANGDLDGGAGPGLGHGLIYRLDKNGTFTELYNFAGGTDGDLPTGNFFLDAAGNLYGTTLLGGGSKDSSCPNSLGCGTVFELSAAGQYKLLYAFRNNSDGSEPGGVVRDSAGNLFGVTAQGGHGCPQVLGCGTIFKIDASGKKTTFYAFTGHNDGSTPSGKLVLDPAGNLYGVATAGGDLNCPYNGGAGCGVVFRIDTKGVETVLHAFHGGTDGFVPSSVIRDGTGILYGTAGGPNGNVCGAVFKLDLLRGTTITYLHNIAGGSEGCDTVGSLVEDAAGNLYGATAFGGYFGNPNVCQNGCGTVFKLRP